MAKSLTTFTSEVAKVASSILGKNFSKPGLMWKEYKYARPKVEGFLLVLRFPPRGKVDKED